MGFKAPRGWGWITNPKRAAYNRAYYRKNKLEEALIGLVITVAIYAIGAALYLIWQLLKLIWSGVVNLFSKREKIPAYIPEQEVDPRFRVKYRDFHGTLTERNIRFIAVNKETGVLMIEAFCELKKEERTFRADRIQECVNLSTGEMIENPVEYFESFYNQAFVDVI